MKHKYTIFIALVTISTLILSACGADSADNKHPSDVASLSTTQDTQADAPDADAADPLLDNEAMMMAFTDCMREQGVDVMDPVVDADGNVQKPELGEGVEWDEETMEDAWETCAHHLEGFTFEDKRDDVSELVDEYMVLAACLREKGHDLEDPTAETLNVWMGDFKEAINWDDPAAVADYEECSGETIGEGGGK